MWTQIFIAGIAVIAIFLLKIMVKKIKKVYAELQAIPTIDQYTEIHPGCKTDRGFKCHKCGSGSIKNWGFSHPEDSKRLFICNHCGEKLYRSFEI